MAVGIGHAQDLIVHDNVGGKDVGTQQLLPRTLVQIVPNKEPAIMLEFDCVEIARDFATQLHKTMMLPTPHYEQHILQAPAALLARAKAIVPTASEICTADEGQREGIFPTPTMCKRIARHRHVNYRPCTNVNFETLQAEMGLSRGVKSDTRWYHG